MKARYTILLPGLVSGILVSLFGVCVTSVAGSLLMAVGMVASAFTTSPYLLYLTYGVIAGEFLTSYTYVSMVGW